MNIELNGVANLSMMVDLLVLEEKLPADEAIKMKEQLDLLERYMLVLAKNSQEIKPIPAWHEVRENKLAYPNRRESK